MKQNKNLQQYDSPELKKEEEILKKRNKGKETNYFKKGGHNNQTR